jgi:hypothetical protein
MCNTGTRESPRSLKYRRLTMFFAIFAAKTPARGSLRLSPCPRRRPSKSGPDFTSIGVPPGQSRPIKPDQGCFPLNPPPWARRRAASLFQVGPDSPASEIPQANRGQSRLIKVVSSEIRPSAPPLRGPLVQVGPGVALYRMDLTAGCCGLGFDETASPTTLKLKS